MVRILFVVPTPEMEEKVYYVLEHHRRKSEMDVTVRVCSAKDAESLNASLYNVIIARGYMADRVNALFPDAILIRINITGFDYVRALLKCREKWHPEKVAICGFEQQLSELHDFATALNMNIELYESVKFELLGDTIQRAIRDGCDTLVGGHSASREAELFGLHAITIETSVNTIQRAFDDALHTADHVQKERILAQTHKTIINTASDGILFVDQGGTIRVYNQIMKKMNGNIAPGNRPLKDVYPYLEKPFLSVMRSGQEQPTHVQHLPAQGVTVSITCRPVMLNQQIMGVVIKQSDISKIQQLENQIRRKLSEGGLNAKYSFSDIVHESTIMKQTIEKARRFAATDANVIIVGETGTGKELFAQSIHQESQRRKGPFVVINCAALPENLLESELFGYSQGAFTGAAKGGKTGLIELAHGGTLFIDEIEEIPLPTQAKLLRVLQERQVRRIGDDKVIDVNVRFISSTNVSIRELCQKRKFRNDLMYRLDVLRLFIPPLRERGNDIELLFRSLLERTIERQGGILPEVPAEAFPLLRKYPFEGNIRELGNIVERICAVSSGGRLDMEILKSALSPEDLPENPDEEAPKYFRRKPAESLDGNQSGFSDGNLSGISDGNLSGISDGNLSGISDGNLSGISVGNLSGISNGNLSGISNGNLSGNLDEAHEKSFPGTLYEHPSQPPDDEAAGHGDTMTAQIPHRIPHSEAPGRSEVADKTGLPTPLSEAGKERARSNIPQNRWRATRDEELLRRIQEALKETDGNCSAAARKLGINRSTLYRKMRKLTSEPGQG